MEPARLEPTRLAPEDSPTGHPCADTSLYNCDLALLSYLLQDLRALARRTAYGEIALDAYDTVVWEVHGLRRRTVICNPDVLLAEIDVQVVGFFGDRRVSPEAAQVDAVELDVISQFEDYPGIVSYSSVELVDNQWANLVVHTDPGDREAWRHSEVHIVAAEQLAPRVYHSVRIHNGRIAGGPMGPENVVIDCTKYFDYDCDPMWHAIRELPRGATETVGSE